MDYNPLFIFILVFTLSQISPVGSSLNWLLCPFDKLPSIFFSLSHFDTTKCIGLVHLPCPSPGNSHFSNQLLALYGRENRKTEPFKISRATIVITKNIL